MDWKTILERLSPARLRKLAANAGLRNHKAAKPALVRTLLAELDPALKVEALELYRGEELRELVASLGETILATGKHELIDGLLRASEEDDAIEENTSETFELDLADVLLPDRGRLDIPAGGREELGVEVFPSRPGAASTTLFYEMQELLRRSSLARAVLVCPSPADPVLARVLSEGLDDLVDTLIRVRPSQTKGRPLVTVVLDRDRHGLGDSRVGRVLVALAQALGDRFELRVARPENRLHAKVFAFEEARPEGPFLTAVVGSAQGVAPSARLRDMHAHVKVAGPLDANRELAGELAEWVRHLLAESRPLHQDSLAKLRADPAALAMVDYKRSFDTAHEMRLKHLAELLARRGRMAPPLVEPALLLDPADHQLAATAQASRPWSSGVLLLDEAGLGKTVEAGMILARELRRKRVHASKHHVLRRRALVVAPRALHAGWVEELTSKMALEVETVGAGSPPDAWRTLSAQVLVLTPDDIAGHGDDVHGFDIVVFDEMQLFDEDAARAASDIRRGAELVIVCASSPVQDEVYDLLPLAQLAAPFDRWRTFEAMRGDDALEQLGQELRAIGTSTRRRELLGDGLLTELEFREEAFDLDRREGRIYHEVRSLRGDYMRRGGHETAGAFVALEEAALSSMQALHALLCRLIGDASGGDDLMRPGLQRDGSLDFLRSSSYFLRRLRALRADVAKRARHDARLSTREAALLDVLAKKPDEAVLVFTRYRATQQRLATVLGRARLRLRVEQLDGAATLRERLGIAARFHARVADRSSPDAPTGALICTDEAAAGLNLQRTFSSLVLFDVPWTPQEIERRISRVRRWGQDADVDAVALVARDAAADRWTMDRSVLYVCREVFGIGAEIDPCSDSLHEMAPIDLEHQIAGAGGEGKLSVVEPPAEEAVSGLAALFDAPLTDDLAEAVERGRELDQLFRMRLADFWNRVSYGGKDLAAARGYLFLRLRQALLQGQVGIVCAPGRPAADCKSFHLVVGLRVVIEAAIPVDDEEPVGDQWLIEDELVCLWGVDDGGEIVDWAEMLMDGGLSEAVGDVSTSPVGADGVKFLAGRKRELEARGLDGVPLDQWIDDAPDAFQSRLDAVREQGIELAEGRVGQLAEQWEAAREMHAERLQARLTMAGEMWVEGDVTDELEALIEEHEAREVVFRWELQGTQIFAVLA